METLLVDPKWPSNPALVQPSRVGSTLDREIGRPDKRPKTRGWELDSAQSLPSDPPIRFNLGALWRHSCLKARVTFMDRMVLDARMSEAPAVLTIECPA
jgi:hypothetical protein